jgi:hypothetical protein
MAETNPLYYLVISSLVGKAVCIIVILIIKNKTQAVNKPVFV